MKFLPSEIAFAILSITKKRFNPDMLDKTKLNNI